MQCTCGTEMIPKWRKYDIYQLRYDCCAAGIHASRRTTREGFQRLLGKDVKQYYFSFYCPECGFGKGMKIHTMPDKPSISEKKKAKQEVRKIIRKKIKPKGYFKMTMINGKPSTVRI